MGYKGSLFYNYPVLKDTLVIVIDNAALAYSVKKAGDVVGLYSDKGELIGVNIFNANNYLRLRLSGLMHTLNEPLIDLVHSLVASSLGEDVCLTESKVILGQVKAVKGSDYMVDVGENKVFPARMIPEGEAVETGDYVLLSYKDQRVDNGRMAWEYLSEGEDYLIVGSEVSLSGEETLGEKTYHLEEK